MSNDLLNQTLQSFGVPKSQIEPLKRFMAGEISTRAKVATDEIFLAGSEVLMTEYKFTQQQAMDWVTATAVLGTERLKARNQTMEKNSPK